MITYILGWILMFEAAFLLVPTVTALVYTESEVLDFLLTIGICLAVSALLIFKKPKNTSLRSRDGFVIVSLSWIVLSLFGAIPFMLTGATTSFVDALFETVSGFTTTGATIFAEMESFIDGVVPAPRKLRWMKLDNAAKIYPAAKRRDWNNTFRHHATYSI